MSVGASGGPRRACVLGSPISHSRSPQLHSAAYAFLGLDIEYTRRDVDQDSLETFLHGEGSASDWVGWSVTMPLKAAMARHVDTRSERVSSLGVLNTVVLSSGEGGRLYGENTDVDGIVGALTEAGVLERQAGAFGILGAGGTASAAAAAAAELGFDEVRVYARSPERAAALGPVAERLGLTLRASPLEALAADVQAQRLAALVSTLPPGAADAAAQTVLPGAEGPVLLDAAYEPWPSVIAAAWTRSGWPVVSGLVMLLHQAVRQVELFTAESRNPAGSLSAADRAEMVRSMRGAVGLG
ncbi:shikimate dehydrogenase [Nesterenkonia sp. NBAIMH1]|uniref:shikimate dehydrogenase n=1 Tax=Nesterenkonia sp. NBAIMH1 TaxID=2600320 RepID=UPI00143DB8AB|nr:shikimate dehydrogenase [Nesterenkonia sp. NBAIMH1]